MAVYLSLFAGAGQQFFTNAGVPLAGGKIYSYGAGGSTPQATYTTSAGNIAHSNPIVLDAAGRVPGGGEIWLTDTQVYKFVLETSAGATIQTLDNVSASIGSAALVASSGSSLIGFIQAGSGAVARTAQSKMRERVTPADFGAVGNGIADDTVAIQAALNAGLAVDFGSAQYTYKVSAPLIVRSQSFLYANGATIRQVTNVTSIFNIVGKTNIHIEGIVFDDTGAGYVANDANPHAPIFGGVGTDFITVTKCKFTNVVYAAVRFQDSNTTTVTENIIIGPGAGTLPVATNLRCYAVLFDADCDKFICSNNQITGTTIGVRIEKASNGVCSGNVIYDTPGQHGFYVGAACNNLTISGNTVTSTALIGIKIQAENGFANLNQINVIGNTVVSCNTGIAFTNGASSNPEVAKIVNSLVEGNVIRDVAATGINIQNSLQTIIANNTVSDCGFSGINISACVLCDISSNFIANCALSGIRDQAASSSVRVINNNIRNVATAGTAGDRFGIFIQTLNAYTITGNRVTSSTATMQYALYMAAGTQNNTIVESNYLFDGTDAALRVASSATNFLSFKNNALYGTTQSNNSSTLPVVASAASITLPTQDDAVRISGTTNITTILSAGHTGHRITLIFDGVLTVTDGSNLKLAGNFTTSADDTLTLVCDGDYWYESSRSAN